MQSDSNEGMRECHRTVTFAFCAPGLPCPALLASLGRVHNESVDSI
jgi:hypothetical protein